MGFFLCEESDYTSETLEELRKLGCKCPNPLYYPDEKDETKNSKKKKSSKNLLNEETIEESKQVLDFAETKIKKIVINQNNTDEVFAIIELNNHVEAISLSSQRAVDWLNYEFTKSLDSTKLHAKDFFKTVLHSLIAKARIEKTPKEKIYNRVAQLENEIWYDLGRDDRKAVKITSKGVFGVTLDSNSPIFRRNQSLQEQIPPRDYDESKKALDELVNLIKISQKDKLIFKIHLISLFLERFPMPIIAIGGASGSFKTTMTAFIKRIVDPSGNLKEDNVTSFQENTDDMKIHFNNRYLASFDNVSYISKEQSDILCRAITGNSNTKRKLYRDSEETVLSYMRKIVLNGIVPNLEYEDLQSRLIFYDRETPDSKNRMTEAQLFKKFDELLPYVLGEIFYILSQVLFWYKTLKNQIKPHERMSDFEVFGEIISRVLGLDDNVFLEIYKEKISDTIISTEGSYPIITVLLQLMKDQNEFEDSASGLFERVVGLAKALDIDYANRRIKFPKGSNKLVKSLKEADYLLRNNGLIVTYFLWKKSDPKYNKNTMVIRIHKKTIQEKLPSPSSLPSPDQKQAQNQGKSGEDSKSILTENSEYNSEDTIIKFSPKTEDSSHENSSSEHSEGSEDMS